MTQVSVVLPGAVPDASQASQRTAVSTVRSRVLPKTASASVTWIRMSASWPRRARVRGPRWAPPPKNASMMSPKSKPPAP